MANSPSILNSASLALAWLQRVHASEHATALLYEDQTWSFSQLHALALNMSSQLNCRQLRHGERLILMMDNGPGFIAAFFAAQMMGLVPVPISPRSSAARLRYVLKDCDAALILVDDTVSERVVQQHASQDYASYLMKILLELDHNATDRSLPPSPLCAFIQYTSGSSGDAKGVMISHQASLSNIRGFSAAMDLQSGDSFSSMLPLFHDMGLLCFCLAPLLLGHTLVLYRAESLQIYRWLEDIEKHQVRITGAPDSLLQIANRVVGEAHSYSLHSLRMLICGSEPVRRESILAFGHRFNAIHAIAPAYGMAELSLCVSLTPAYDKARINSRGQVASGLAIDQVSVRILDENDFPTTEPGICGEILVRSPAAMMGYWGKPESSALAFDDHGYFKTGDLGFLDEDGYLFVVGRLKNLLVRAGEKYSAHDIESVAQQIDGVRRAAVVQSENCQGTIFAVLEVDRRMLTDTTSLQQITQGVKRSSFAAVGLAPDRCGFVASGDLPCTENGKLRHATLRAKIDASDFKAVWSHQLESCADAVAVD